MKSGTRRLSFALCLALAVNLVLPLAPALAAANDDVLPGVPASLWRGPAGHVDAADAYDVYWIQIQRDEQLTVRWSGSAGLNATMVVLPPAAASHLSGPVATSTSNAGSAATLHYQEKHGPGRYYIVVHRTAGSGNYGSTHVGITATSELGMQVHRRSVQAYMPATGITSHWWTIWCERGKEILVTLVDPPGTGDDFDLYLYTDDGTLARNSTPKVSNVLNLDLTTAGITPAEWGPGDYAPVYVRVSRWTGSGPYVLAWSVSPRPGWSGRISGRTRFDVARELQIATRSPVDEHVSDVVVASGDDAAMADPLAAGGLCWAYNAPLLLVSKNSARNAETLIRIQDIRGFSGKVRVHVVGGPVTIPPDVYDSLRIAAGGSAYIERISGANRYDLARNIALRMRSARNDHVPGVLLANGADSEKFFDALALSPISTMTGMPVLLVRKDSVPAETLQALASISGTTPRFLAGGPLTVSEPVRAGLGATRWAGPDRYATAATIAKEGVTRDYLVPDNIALAAKLPDALSAGANVGFLGGPVLVVRTESLPTPARDFLSEHKSYCMRLWPVGGPLSIHNAVITQAKTALQ